jgi:ribonuclease P/MRP protein subunit RPP40
LEKANVSAVFKKGSRRDPGNYRPISLTCHFCKLLERIIKDQMINYLEGKNLLRETQHGFRKGKSCLTNLLEFIEDVTNIVDKGGEADVLYLDFQKAFDKVAHERLFIKLNALGFEGKLLEWLKSWLTGRKQRVVIDGDRSEWAEVTSGVPQGSVLGPILFLVFINDIDEGLSNKLFKFADDIKLLGQGHSMEQKREIQSDLQKLLDWSEKWQMRFNIEKCKWIHFGKENDLDFRFEMNGKHLEELKEIKDLGIIVSHDLKVGNQCHTAAKKSNQVLGLIQRTFKNKKLKMMKILYKSLVRPHIDYNIQAWRPHLVKDINILERVQRRATRMIEECKGKNYVERLRLANLTDLETRRSRADLIEVYRIMTGIDRIEMGKFFERNI